ncbi:SRPBCC family protein [Streptomyces sp. NBC_00690]|uniref:SRPBCC family protein n=1 Tax=Streptomyces sp. NBC_00690 TaxID=2975808 RepID=UPI002E2D3B68|nr:SRPBCC family protein [Streptomyces sp. NBC_00690]
MTVRHRLIRRPPAAVWAVLANGSRYGEWVVGPDSSRPAEGDWPQIGASLEYTVRLGPWAGSGRTVVRDMNPPHRIELEAESGRLGTARISIEVRPWGENSLVIVDEHPLRGLGGQLHNPAFDFLLQLRNRRMLSRLADVVEQTSRPPAEHR